ncbi:DEAD/DEAH box helicase [uncultured Methanobrevibacter sp.]|uniref:SNF2-related protein n=1 Tax=uncultured Methanobrevibacter sp. TaxID=253161 RepID=UPI00261F80BD|nr:DEAD/DEAH box helicase [uncultured Methanobrevibacter sp.]
MKLYPHQTEGLEAVKDLDHVAFYWDMGLGKTYAGSEKMMQLGAKVNLVVCQKSKIQDWYDHFKENYTQCVVQDLTNEKDLNLFLSRIEHGFLSKCFHIGIINYDLIWRRKELLKLKDFTLLLDESSLIQTETAKRSKFILKMQPKNVILLSGTPTGGKYEKLWSQMHLLGWNISKQLYWKQFVKVEYLDTVGRSIPIVTGYKNVDRLKRKMNQYGCQFLKTDEVFDLPDQVFQKMRIPASKEYRIFKKDRVVEMGNGTLVGDTTLTKMLYERMLCGHFSEAKLKAFADLVESTDDRLVVFYNFTAELESMIQVVQKNCERSLSFVNGSDKDLTAYENYDDSITFVQYQAGAMGLNLQKANKMIFFSLPLSSELYEQSKKRIHRIGQNRPCFYYQLIVKGSIEEKILKTLEMRKDYTEKLFEKDDEQ